MTVREMKRRLVGRKIVGFEANAFRDGVLVKKNMRNDRDAWEPPANGGAITYDPVLILDDGTRVSFRAHETEIGEYGIDIKIIVGAGK